MFLITSLMKKVSDEELLISRLLLVKKSFLVPLAVDF